MQPPPDDLRAWRGMVAVHIRLVKALDARLEAAHGLPLTSYEGLARLGDAVGRRMRMSELADSVLLSRSGVTRLVDRLERDGLLSREACSDDARGAYACLTEDGLARLEAARVTHLEGVRALFLDRLTGDERRALADLWERMQKT